MNSRFTVVVTLLNLSVAFAQDPQVKDPNVFYYNGQLYRINPNTKEAEKAEKVDDKKENKKRGGLLLSKNIKKYLK